MKHTNENEIVGKIIQSSIWILNECSYSYLTYYLILLIFFTDDFWQLKFILYNLSNRC